MRHVHHIMVVCDGCNATADALREVASIGVGEGARIVEPEGWVRGSVQPAMVLAVGQPVSVDPFEAAGTVATKLGKPVPILSCPACAAAEAGPRPVLAS